MVSYLKTSFFLLLLLLFTACEEGGQPTEDNDHEPLASEDDTIEEDIEQTVQKDANNYLGEFQYTFNNCNGPLSEELNNQIKNDSCHIKVDKNVIQFLRPKFIDSLNVRVKGSWDNKDNSLSQMKGQFGISNNHEDWIGASGYLIFIGNRIEGNVSNVKVIFGDTSCDLSMEFEGKSI